MSLITIMGDIPLYSTVEEAEVWGSTFGIQGYHTHVFQDQTGYMAGYTHGDIELALESFNLNAGDYVGNYINTGTGTTGGGANNTDIDTDTQTQTNTPISFGQVTGEPSPPSQTGDTPATTIAPAGQVSAGQMPTRGGGY